MDSTHGEKSIHIECVSNSEKERLINSRNGTVPEKFKKKKKPLLKTDLKGAHESTCMGNAYPHADKYFVK